MSSNRLPVQGIYRFGMLEDGRGHWYPAVSAVWRRLQPFFRSNTREYSAFVRWGSGCEDRSLERSENAESGVVGR